MTPTDCSCHYHCLYKIKQTFKELYSGATCCMVVKKTWSKALNLFSWRVDKHGRKWSSPKLNSVQTESSPNISPWSSPQSSPESRVQLLHEPKLLPNQAPTELHDIAFTVLEPCYITAAAESTTAS